MTDICCIGHITRDKIITPRTTTDMAGGTSFYMSQGICRLPEVLSYKLVTKVGRGQLHEVEKLRRLGIDVLCYPSRHTVCFENKYGADTNHRTQRVPAKADPFTIKEVSTVSAKVFHLGSLLNDDFPTEVVEYLAGKGKVSIDAQGYLRQVVGQQVCPISWKDKEAILSCTDILKLNEHEMEIITHSKNPRTVAAKLAAYGVKEVVITLGSAGSLIYAEGKYYEIPAYAPQEVVDATGCGDTYSTGYLYCRMQGMNYMESGKFAAAMCTLKLEHSGPFDRTISDITRIVHDNT